jgi:hypothetical protein
VEASNCEIIADEVLIEVAEGCAIAGRNVELESAGPRRRRDADLRAGQGRDAVLTRRSPNWTARGGFAQANQASKQELDRISALPDVRRYLALAAKLRTQERC